MKPRGTSDSSSQTAHERHYKINIGGSQTTVVEGDPVVLSNSLGFNGWDLDRYHARKKAGELLPHTPYESWNVFSSWSARYHNVRSSGEEYKTDSNWSHPSSLVPWELTKDELFDMVAGYDTHDLVQAASSKIYSSGHDSLTFAVEFNKVVRMFKNVRKTLVKLLKDSKYRGIDSVADGYLEYRYGWRILYFDIISLYGAIEGLQDKRRSRYSERVGRNVTSTDVALKRFLGSVDDFTVVQTTELNISLRGSVTADIEPASFSFNPIVTAWETVKYSFIVDWVLGIGQWIASMSFIAISSNHSGSGGIKVTASRTGRLSLSSPVGTSVSVDHDFQSSSVGTAYFRIPQPVSLTPFVRIKLDTLKFIDLWALFRESGKVGHLRR